MAADSLVLAESKGDFLCNKFWSCRRWEAARFAFGTGCALPALQIQGRSSSTAYRPPTVKIPRNPPIWHSSASGFSPLEDGRRLMILVPRCFKLLCSWNLGTFSHCCEQNDGVPHTKLNWCGMLCDLMGGLSFLGADFFCVQFTKGDHITPYLSWSSPALRIPVESDTIPYTPLTTILKYYNQTFSALAAANRLVRGFAPKSRILNTPTVLFSSVGPLTFISFSEVHVLLMISPEEQTVRVSIQSA